VKGKPVTFQKQAGKPRGCTLLTSKFQGQLGNVEKNMKSVERDSDV